MSSLAVRVLALFIFISFINITKVENLEFSFAKFEDISARDIIQSSNTRIYLGAIQLTPDVRGASMQNRSGRAFYNEKLKQSDPINGMEASFRTTFLLNVANQTSPGGEGLAFILSKDTSLPENSAGQWLGIMNSTTVGQSGNVVAVEFDTNKSYQDDLDDNHVGVDINSIFSAKQESLESSGIFLSNGIDVVASIDYDAAIGRIKISLKQGENMKNLSYDVHLSDHLPADVYVGFSASTWANTQLNCVKSWNFTSFDVSRKRDTRKRNSNFLWVWLLIPSVTITLLIAVSCILYWRKKNKRKKQIQVDPEIEKEIQSSSTAPKKFRLKELISATENFNPTYKLGKGGFGTVYKGIICNNEVAVKRPSKNSDHRKQDFIAEITTIGNLHHKNLVKLFGWCYESDELLLVYEYLPNGSLDRLLFYSETMSSGMNNSILSWERRYSIIHGVARALDYLHYGCAKRVIHRDVKASNIMLDSDFNARLGDFGLARTIESSENTHHSTKEIAGTPGYMAPESFHTGRATVETDVYAFGVLTLEIASGRKPGYQGEENDFNSIIDWVWSHYRMDSITDVIDARLDGNFDKEQTECILVLGLACCHPNPYQRPSMRTIMQVLSGEVSLPKVPIERPAFMWPPIIVATSIREDSVQLLSGGRLTPTMELSGR